MIKLSKNRFNLSDEDILTLFLSILIGSVISFSILLVVFVHYKRVSVVGKVQAKYLYDMRYVLDRMPYESDTVAVKTGDTVIQCSVDSSQFHQMQPGDIGIVAKSIESFAGHEDSDCVDFKKLSGHKANH